MSAPVMRVAIHGFGNQRFSKLHLAPPGSSTASRLAAADAVLAGHVIGVACSVTPNARVTARIVEKSGFRSPESAL